MTDTPEQRCVKCDGTEFELIRECHDCGETVTQPEQPPAAGETHTSACEIAWDNGMRTGRKDAQSKAAADLARLREAMREFGKHHGDCATELMSDRHNPVCDCGFDDALEGRDEQISTG